MSAKHFLKAFPATSTINHNCLVDMGCPKCGQRDSFKVFYSTRGLFTDEGMESEIGSDQEWDSKGVECGACQHTTALSAFRHPGLDDALWQLRCTTPDVKVTEREVARRGIELGYKGEHELRTSGKHDEDEVDMVFAEMQHDFKSVPRRSLDDAIHEVVRTRKHREQQ